MYVYTKFDRILTERVTFTFALYLNPFTTDNIILQTKTWSSSHIAC